MLLLFISCNIDSPSNIEDSEDPIDLSNYFPLNIGNTWIYYSFGGAELAVVQHSVIDTLIHSDGTKLFKMKKGILGFPTDSYYFEYYAWKEDGLWYYFCESDTCFDGVGNAFPLIKYLQIKTPVNIGHEWTTESWISNKPIFIVESLDTLELHNEWGSFLMDSIFYEVATISRYNINSGDTTITQMNYAPNVGYIGSDNYDLLHFEIYNDE